MPHTAAQFPRATLIINASGCLFIGALMVLLLELTSPHRLLRPLLGVGVLGGFTTFSIFAVDTAQLVRQHRALIALAYVVMTLALCVLAVFASTTVTRLVGRLVLESDFNSRAGRSR